MSLGLRIKLSTEEPAYCTNKNIHGKAGRQVGRWAGAIMFSASDGTHLVEVI